VPTGHHSFADGMGSELHGMGAAFQGNRKVSLIAWAAEIGGRGGEPHGAGP
jgi:hypothetical protein